MRRLIWTVMILLIVAGSAALLLAGEVESRTGYLMPLACKDRSAEGGAAGHTTACALAPDCVSSGFGLFAGDVFLKFDKKGHEMALEYFRNATKNDNHKVVVVGDFSNQEIAVHKIEPIDQ